MKAATFREAIDAVQPLKWKAGLKATKRGEGKGQIVAADDRRVVGSAHMDEDCRLVDRNANRWDYVIGYQRAKQTVAYFVEVHSAETSNSI